MWSSRRAVILGAGALAGCGFTPVYGPGGETDARALRGRIAVDAPTDRDGFAFVEQMESRLGRASDPLFTLSYALESGTSGIAIDGTNAITRFNIEGAIRFEVRPVGEKTPVTSGTVRSFTSYSASGSTIDTLTSERDARRRLMVILADRIVTRLLVDPALT